MCAWPDRRSHGRPREHGGRRRARAQLGPYRQVFRTRDDRELRARRLPIRLGHDLDGMRVAFPEDDERWPRGPRRRCRLVRAPGETAPRCRPSGGRPARPKMVSGSVRRHRRRGRRAPRRPAREDPRGTAARVAAHRVPVRDLTPGAPRVRRPRLAARRLPAPTQADTRGAGTRGRSHGRRRDALAVRPNGQAEPMVHRRGVIGFRFIRVAPHAADERATAIAGGSRDGQVLAGVENPVTDDAASS